MITIGEWLNPTRAVGLLSYGTAATCCGVAWVRLKNQQRDCRLAALLTLIESTLLLDIAFNWRWRLHQFVVDVAQRRHEYELRHEPQSIAFVILAALLLFGLFVTQRFHRLESGARLAVSGSLLSVAVWCVEVVSLHAVDLILYRLVGKLMVVSLLWILACSMTAIGILFFRIAPKPRLG